MGQPITIERFSDVGEQAIRKIVQDELAQRNRFKLHWNVDDTFEAAFINLIAVWSSAHNPTENHAFTLELMDRLGWFVERASAIYHDLPLLDIGTAIRELAKDRGFISELPE